MSMWFTQNFIYRVFTMACFARSFLMAMAVFDPLVALLAMIYPYMVITSAPRGPYSPASMGSLAAPSWPPTRKPLFGC